MAAFSKVKISFFLLQRKQKYYHISQEFRLFVPLILQHELPGYHFPYTLAICTLQGF